MAPRTCAHLLGRGGVSAPRLDSGRPGTSLTNRTCQKCRGASFRAQASGRRPFSPLSAGALSGAPSSRSCHLETTAGTLVAVEPSSRQESEAVLNISDKPTRQPGTSRCGEKAHPPEPSPSFQSTKSKDTIVILSRPTRQCWSKCLAKI